MSARRPPADDPRLLAGEHSAAFLPEAGPRRRRPRLSPRPRPAAFHEAFEDRALYYDCFWHADGERIILVGPPPLNLATRLGRARFFTRPLNVWLEARTHRSASVMITELVGAPPQTREIEVRLGETSWILPVQPNFSGMLARRRVLFTMSRDNELDWIAEWAGYHARVQGADAVILFDNGSTRYGPGDVAETLLAVPGLAQIAVLSWPYRYGAPDPSVVNNPFYTLFLQIASMSVALRRYGALATGLLNCDIDELVASPAGTDVFSLAAASRQGLIVMRGQRIAPIPVPGAPTVPTHRDFVQRPLDPRQRQDRQKKWVLDPSRDWVQSLAVHPYMHWIENRPLFAKTQREDVFYWHFAGISTGWKDRRHLAESLDPARFEPDPAWSAQAATLPPR